MRDVYVIGVNMTRFAKCHDRNLKSLASEAVEGALTHAGISKADIPCSALSSRIFASCLRLQCEYVDNHLKAIAPFCFVNIWTGICWL